MRRVPFSNLTKVRNVVDYWPTSISLTFSIFPARESSTLIKCCCRTKTERADLPSYLWFTCLPIICFVRSESVLQLKNSLYHFLTFGCETHCSLIVINRIPFDYRAGLRRMVFSVRLLLCDINRLMPARFLLNPNKRR